MEHMVFGDPITEETLRGMDEYKNKTTITRTDIAYVALSAKDAVEAQASEYLEKLKGDQSASDVGVITYGKIHNLTGYTIMYSVDHNFSGKAPSGYPDKIKNGQSGMFTHKETSGSKSGSCGAVVYMGTNDNEEACDLMFSWSNPTNRDNRLRFCFCGLPKYATLIKRGEAGREAFPLYQISMVARVLIGLSLIPKLSGESSSGAMHEYVRLGGLAGFDPLLDAADKGSCCLYKPNPVKKNSMGINIVYGCSSVTSEPHD
ncbi:hypothetical protein LOK49_LG02G01808 [Camellia lanceoleosa]|uniref:Uncharacterized protein n=1 Tax=Camellia lanceoleosa TaxID=1840588 RepID=A0ACC0IJX9_9ERIC|nr:hypothetical protein LOK49_LG02G01808 [Camellia lanceoleosa]